MWDSVAKHVKNFRFESTVHPKNIKGTLVFNDVSINVVTSVRMQQSWFSSYLVFFSSPLRYCFSLLGKKVFLQTAWICFKNSFITLWFIVKRSKQEDAICCIFLTWKVLTFEVVTNCMLQLGSFSVFPRKNELLLPCSAVMECALNSASNPVLFWASLCRQALSSAKPSCPGGVWWDEISHLAVLVNIRKKNQKNPRFSGK